ncbi:MAG: hypothetical protein LAO51_01665, partial [Acidobacteriia bacterium]|nr:hypothetical protein [Terriglobia bacterium]
YDILIGMLWTRIGTATPRAGSGTLEEFEKAMKRHQEQPGSIAIMFYFKDAPVAPSQLDPDQLRGVSDFKAGLTSRGCLHWSFRDKDELAQYLRLHIPREIARLSEAVAANGLKGASSLAPRPESIPLQDEEGFLNLMERVVDGVATSGSVLQRLSADTAALGAVIEKRTAELVALPQRHGQPDFRGAKRIADSVASELDAYAARMEADVPRLSSTYDQAFDALARGIAMSLEAGAPTPVELTTAFRGPESLASAIAEVEIKVGQFRAVLTNIPRATTDLNHARRRAVKALDSLLSEFKRMRLTALELRNVVEGRSS